MAPVTRGADLSQDAEAIVVGTGPSGVSVALPLVDAGRRVILLDAGAERPSGLLPSGAYHDLRRADGLQWRAFLGPRLEALRPAGPPSPKFDAPGARYAFAGAAAEERIEGRGFAAIVSHARGGLSGIWGAGISAWGDEDLAAFPLGAGDLADSYRRVAQRIGVTGFGADDLASPLDEQIPSLPPLVLAESARRLLRRYERRRRSLHALGLRLGRARAAVLTEPRPDRGACAYCDLCVWGCAEQAIWSATHDLVRLAGRAAADYRPGLRAESIGRRPDGRWEVRVRPAGQPGAALTLRAPRLVLAAGALVTARLVLELQQRFGEVVPMRGAPGVGFALCLPERLGGSVSTREFSMGQLSFSAEGDPGRPADAAYGTLFPASGLPAARLIEHMPLSRPVAIRAFRRLQPALLVGNCFLPGRYSRSAARLERGADGQARLIVEGSVSEDFPARLAGLARQIGRGFRRLGAWLLPGSLTPIGPGEDARYSGCFPMRALPGPGETDLDGQLHGAPGLHLVDLSIFPSMSAKHHTLTLMANADRIGRALAAG
jgi:hypothetical protein